MANALNSRRLSLLALVAAPLLMGGACEKNPGKAGDTGGVIGAADRADEETGPVDETPLPNISIDKLGPEKTKLFYKLIGSFNSPCGKGHSLRTSFSTDNSCKRAPFAVRYLVALLGEEAPEETVRKLWNEKYTSKASPIKLDTSKAPFEGNPDARIKIAEFFDYACPHCQSFKPEMERVIADHGGKVVEYFMMFPLEKGHPNSRSAAQAVLAANAQGKFKEMHDLLFAKSPAHDHAAVTEYAKQLGLDMTKFEADYVAASAQVTRDQQQGDAAGVDSTPTVFFNDRKYEGPLMAKYISLWIEEELAVNR